MNTLNLVDASVAENVMHDRYPRNRLGMIDCAGFGECRLFQELDIPIDPSIPPTGSACAKSGSWSSCARTTRRAAGALDEPDRPARTSDFPRR